MAEISAAAAGTITIGNMTVNRLGLGTNRITDTPAAHELLQKAVGLSVNFIDTAHRYGSGASETAIGNALTPYKPGVVVATKGGYNFEGTNGSPEALRRDLEESLRLLKTDCIDLYQLHRVDPDVPLEESVGALKTFQAEGKIRHIGLSEVTVEQLQQAQKVATIASVQNQYNVLVRRHEALVDYCTEQGVAFIPWFPLGGLSGGSEQVENELRELAAKYNATPQQLALAWLLRRSPMILPIPGTLSVAHLEENLAAGAIVLSDEDYRELTELTA
ncbi:MAG TPA: aldo/keto reductase [Candidatus Saccharimonadales bacterium]|jgi:aryl-alcohol dehydrogenase-like predicted oxidoreductase